MKNLRIFALLVCALPLCAINLLKYEIYPSEQNESVNITLSFDGVYDESKLTEKRDKEAVWLTLNGVNYPKEELKTINSPLIKGILVRPNAKENKLIVGLQAKSDVRINTEMRQNNYVLMIRALDKNAPTSAGGLFYKPEPQQNKFESKFDYTSYILIMVLLLLLLGVLLWLSRSAKRGRNIKEFRVLFQRPLDKNNKFVILEFGSKSFVMILGTSNILLETIDKDSQSPNAPQITQSTIHKETLTPIKKTSKSFENFFEENKERLQKLIKGKENQNESSKKG